VVVIDAFVNTDRDHRKLGEDIVRVASGPTFDAFGCQVEVYLDGRSVMEDAAGSVRDPPWTSLDSVRVDDESRLSSIAHGGQVSVFRLYVNTTRDLYDVRKAVLRVARGPRLDAVILLSGVAHGEEGERLWRIVQDTVVAATSPGSPGRSPGSQPE